MDSAVSTLLPHGGNPQHFILWNTVKYCSKGCRGKHIKTRFAGVLPGKFRSGSQPTYSYRESKIQFWMDNKFSSLSWLGVFFFAKKCMRATLLCIKIEKNGSELHFASQLHALAHLLLDYIIKVRAKGHNTQNDCSLTKQPSFVAR